MAKLNQVIAIEKGIKARVYAGLTDLNKAVQKGELFNGFNKTYRKTDEAGEEHPAQTQIVTEDVIAGYWDTVKHSGAMPKPEKDALLERIDKLARGVKEAREAANMADETEIPPVGDNIFAYLYGEQA